MVWNVCLFQFYCLLIVVKKKQMWIIILESMWIGMYDLNLSFSINKGDLNSEKGYWLFSALHAKCFDVYQKRSHVFTFNHILKIWYFNWP